MNIVLIGMRATGKTTIGNMLSRSLKRDFIETDELIAKKSGRSISDLVDTFGWNYFRDLESQIVQEASLQDEVVISTGGGVVLRDENVIALKRTGFIVLLNAKIDTLVQRMKNNADRPPLTGAQTMRDEIVQILKERSLLYKKTCDVRVSTDEKNTKEVEQAILEIIKEKHI